MSSSAGLPETSEALSTETEEILKGVKRLGLKLSEHEIERLLCGKTMSLEDRSLSEIGSVFILAQALSKLNSLNYTAFKDLLKVVTNLSNHPGLPIYYWNSEHCGRCCLLLSLVDSKPVIKSEFGRCNMNSEDVTTLFSKPLAENSF